VNARETTTSVTPLPGAPADAGESPELRRGIEAKTPAVSPDTKAPDALDWREKLWRTSRTVFWNWD
jgi:hypothetical protein